MIGDVWKLFLLHVTIPRESTQKYDSLMQLMHRGKKRNTEFSLVNLKERNYLEEKGVEGMIILKCMLIGRNVLVQDRVYLVDCSK